MIENKETVERLLNEISNKIDNLMNKINKSKTTFKLGNRIEDERGFIQNLVFTDMQSAAIISSKKGSVRSEHFHKTGFHYLYVISGEMQYFERPLNGMFPEQDLIVKAGGMVYTGPEIVHKTVFLQDTVLLSLTSNHSQSEQELDTVKEKF